MKTIATANYIDLQILLLKERQNFEKVTIKIKSTGEKKWEANRKKERKAV